MSISRFRKLLTIFMIVLLSVLAFEFLAGFVLDLDDRRKMYAKTRDVYTFHDDHVRFEPELGFVLEPDIRYRQRNLEFEVGITVNSVGLRDDEASIHQPDILAIGDSFVFGTGVTDGDTVADVLEAELGLKVLNAGVPQYGTLQETIVFDRLASSGMDSHCMAFMFFFAGNDLINNVNSVMGRDNYHPWIDQHQDPFEVVYPTRKGYFDWRSRIAEHRYPMVSQYSYTAYMLMSAWKELTADADYQRRKIKPSEPINALDFIVTGFAESLPAGRKRNIAFVYIPLRTYYEQTAYKEKADMEFNRIAAIMRRNAIEFIDLRRVLSKPDYYEYDGHWRPEGHKKVAATLVNYMNGAARAVCP